MLQARALNWSRWESFFQRREVQRIVPIVLFLLVVGTAFSYFRRVSKGKSAFVRWYPQIVELRHGKNIFLGAEKDGHAYPHPPFSAALLCAFTLLPLKTAAGIWLVLKLGAVFGSLDHDFLARPLEFLNCSPGLEWSDIAEWYGAILVPTLIAFVALSHTLLLARRQSWSLPSTARSMEEETDGTATDSLPDPESFE